MITLHKKTKEVDITLKWSKTIGGNYKIDILGDGDLSHHLVEELFMILDNLSRMEEVSHKSIEYTKNKYDIIEWRKERNSNEN